MKAWAATVRGSQEIVSPSFVASEIFPKDPCFEHFFPFELKKSSKLLITKRFEFDPTSLSLLKARLSVWSRGPTRMEVTKAVIWKAAVKTASFLRPFSPESPYSLFSTVNLRKRASPPLPDNSIGNIIIPASALCFPESQPDLPTLMGELRESIAKLNVDYINSLKGKNGHETVKQIIEGVCQVAELGDCLFASSVLNCGLYELDFGWGKPLWFHFIDIGNANFVALSDTLNGGVQATITLSNEEMEIFERDQELLSYATVNPSPLPFLKH